MSWRQTPNNKISACVKSHTRDDAWINGDASLESGEKKVCENKVQHCWNWSKPFSGCIISCDSTGPFVPMRKEDLAQGKLCSVCNLYSPREPAHRKSPWIHKEQKNYSWYSKSHVIGFTNGLSNHKCSSSRNRKPQNKYDAYWGFYFWTAPHSLAHHQVTETQQKAWPPFELQCEFIFLLCFWIFILIFFVGTFTVFLVWTRRWRTRRCILQRLFIPEKLRWPRVIIWSATEL